MRRILLFAALLCISAIGSAQKTNIIPEPAETVPSSIKGHFTINKKTQIILHGIGHENAFFYLSAYLKKNYEVVLLSWMDTPIVNNAIHLRYLKTAKPITGAYTLTVNKDGVYIDGDDAEGVFHGVQSFIQLLPPLKGKPFDLPYLTIRDYPRFEYRGMMLDVGRHFMPVSFIKKYIDFLALHKMNYFHWHLTDDQGWRIEIKKYPQLTNVGAWRNGTIIGKLPGKGSDNIRSGGFYTQEEVYDIIDYAEKRYVTIIPEIEMPGHASAAIASYPWLSCFPDKKTKLPESMRADVSKNSNGKLVQESWGVHEDVFCAGKDSTFTFLEGVLDEVIKIFPSKFIHIGGDECPKSNWKICERCQERMKKEGLKDEHELQSYFISRMEGYLNKRGRSIIGWDEILEGGLAPNATVMSWRGEAGGIAAAKLHHPVIMTPTTYVYFDYAASRKEDSLNIGGFLPLDKVYNYEPLAKELSADEAKYIRGAQANLWTEYIDNPRKAEYFSFPRMSALSEVVWSPKAKKSWTNFERKLPTLFKRYDLWDVHFSKAYFDINASVIQNATKNGIEWKLESKKVSPETTIGYIFPDNTSTYTNYSKPIPIKETGTGRALVIDTSLTFTIELKQNFKVNKATGHSTTLKFAPHENYRANGAFSLVNGIVSETGLSSSDWLGWAGQDMDATINMGKVTTVKTIQVHSIDEPGSWIHKPKEVTVWVSDDGMKFKKLASSSDFHPDTLNTGYYILDLNNQKARYIRVVAKNSGIIPAGNAGAGSPAWLFIDEIQVN